MTERARPAARLEPGAPLRVLMIAYACSPAKHGEHLLGWEWATRLACRSRVTVLTRSPHLADAEGLTPRGLSMVGVDDRSFKFLRRLGWPGLQAYYRRWQHAAARLGRRLLAAGRFDIVHQCTFHTCRIPGLLAAPGQPPFVWGPVSGLERIPMRLLTALGAGAVREGARSVCTKVVPHLPSIRRTLRHSYAVLVSNRDTLERLRAVVPRPYVLLPANAVELPLLPPYDAGEGDLDLLAVGELVRMRAFDLVLEALAGLPPERGKRVRMTFIGDGQDLPRLHERARALGLEGRVTFAGRQPRAETLERMARAHLLALPSLRDSGSSAVAEAMSMGLPVAALRLAGPGSMLSEGGGFLVEARARGQVVCDLRTLIDRVLDNRDLLWAESARGRAAARRLLDWNERIERVERIYHEACGLREADRAALGA